MTTYMRAYNADRRKQLIAAGLCRDCKDPAEGGKTRCKDCLAILNAKKIEKRRSAAIESGGRPISRILAEVALDPTGTRRAGLRVAWL